MSSVVRTHVGCVSLSAMWGAIGNQRITRHLCWREGPVLSSGVLGSCCLDVWFMSQSKMMPIQALSPHWSCSPRARWNCCFWPTSNPSPFPPPFPPLPAAAHFKFVHLVIGCQDICLPRPFRARRVIASALQCTLWIVEPKLIPAPFSMPWTGNFMNQLLKEFMASPDG